MKKVTIALGDDLARWLGVKAAETGRSSPQWIAESLEQMRRGEDDYEAAMRRYLAMKPRRLEWPGGRRPTRDELHDRARPR